ncbi:MAG: type III-B CRISPR module RAMP protein Cmr4 [Acetivibrionales bacterium]|jgi:CRISPR-associated protein Cmr4
MYKTLKPFFIICETPLHVGSGNDLGIVDLPVQREIHTNYPKIEASSLKGSIREEFRKQLNEGKLKQINGKNIDKNDFFLAFGPDEGDLHAGALGFTDARILLFPVKSMKGVFGWITCKNVLERFKRDLEIAGIKDIPEIPKQSSMVKDSNLKACDNKVVLEEYTIDELSEDDTCEVFAKWLAEKIFPEEVPDNYKYWREKMKKDILVVENNDFNDFVTLSTEVVTRTKIDTITGTVKSGALFTEEYVPSDSVFYSLALSSPVFNKEKGVFQENGKPEEELVMEFFEGELPKIVQIGGNATLGKGITRMSILK